VLKGPTACFPETQAGPKAVSGQHLGPAWPGLGLQAHHYIYPRNVRIAGVTRIEHMQKRIEKMKHQGWLCARDESTGMSPDEEQKDEVDELAEDDGEGEKWVKPVLKEEVWD